MPGLSGTFRNQITCSLSAAKFATVAAPIVLVFVSAMPSRAQSQNQSTAATAPAFEYEVASVKPNKSGGNVIMRTADDGLTVTNFPLQRIIQTAFGIPEYLISGAPEWINSENYDIDAKMGAATADALKKLSIEDRRLARQRMLQALLVDRFKLTFRRDSKELPVYWLASAKNGYKLHEAKPGDTYANGIPVPAGRSGVGMMMLNGGDRTQTLTAQAVPIANLERSLAVSLGRPVLDKTALAGLYDFTLTYALDPGQLQGLSGGAPSTPTPNGQPPLSAPDPAAPNILAAVQEQLGLKLESGKGPVEIIVIDRVERPSGN